MPFTVTPGVLKCCSETDIINCVNPVNVYYGGGR